MSLSKTKLMVAGHDVQVKAPIHLEDGKIEHMDSSACLGSVVSSNGRIDAEIDMHIANASMVFGALHHAVFNDRNLTTSTKRQVYKCQHAALYSMAQKTNGLTYVEPSLESVTSSSRLNTLFNKS